MGVYTLVLLMMAWDITRRMDKTYMIPYLAAMSADISRRANHVLHHGSTVWKSLSYVMIGINVKITLNIR